MYDNAMMVERNGLLATIDPQVITDSEVYSDYIDMTEIGQVMAIIMSGDMDANGGVTAKIYENDGSSDTELKAIDAHAAHADDNDNLQWVLNVRADELNGDNYRIRLGLISDTSQTGILAAVLLASDHRYGWPYAGNLDSVDEIVK